MTGDLCVLAIDPGTAQSGWVYFFGGKVIGAGVMPNDELLAMVGESAADVLAIERFEARGMAIGDESVVTILWTGRFMQAWRSPKSVRLVKRSQVKSYLCGTQKAKDANIAQALIDRFAPGQPNRGKGTKAAPGWFHGFAADMWQAYALAVLVADRAHARAGAA